MDFKSIDDLAKAIKKYPIDEPLIVVVDGKDTALFNFISQFIETQVYKNVPVEISIFTGEQEDYSHFINDIYNYSLFVSYRLFVVRQSHIIIKNIKNFVIKDIPPKTWIIFEYEGSFPLKALKIPEGQIFHFETKILYENQIDKFIYEFAKKYRLVFSEEAITEMKVLFPPKESLLRTAIMNIARSLSQEQQSQEYYVTYEDIRRVFYPTAGWDIFKMIDAILNRDLQTFLIEIEKYNPPEDNYYNLLKNLLLKIEEIRKYQIAKRLNFSQKELLKYIQADKKPVFIQNKILQQLERIVPHYSLEKLQKIYQFLVEISFGFRQNIEEGYKKTVFVKKVIEVFF